MVGFQPVTYLEIVADSAIIRSPIRYESRGKNACPIHLFRRKKSLHLVGPSHFGNTTSTFLGKFSTASKYALFRASRYAASNYASYYLRLDLGVRGSPLPAWTPSFPLPYSAQLGYPGHGLLSLPYDVRHSYIRS